jgi:thiazole synthase
MEEMVESIKSSGAEIITIAIGRLNLDNPNEKTILDHFDWNQYTILPNTAGSKTADDAVFIAKLAREITGTNWVKLEVIPDPSHLLPDPIGTYDAAKILIADGFNVLPYISADPVLAKRLEEIGCSTVMPLGSGIGTGQGIITMEQINIIIQNSNIPVVVDAGLAVPSDASKAMEAGADAVLVNSAIALANNPSEMGHAFKLGVEAGRKSYLAGRMTINKTAITSSPGTDVT